MGYDSIVASKPYGPEVEIKKVRLSGIFRSERELDFELWKQSGKKLSDGKRLGGNERLTDTAIKQKFNTFIAKQY